LWGSRSQILQRVTPSEFSPTDPASVEREKPTTSANDNPTAHQNVRLSPPQLLHSKVLTNHPRVEKTFSIQTPSRSARVTKVSDLRPHRRSQGCPCWRRQKDAQKISSGSFLDQTISRRTGPSSSGIGNGSPPAEKKTT
jgi:hypothetical protein